MNIISWNVRGLKSSPTKRARVAALVRRLHPQILYFQEHKCTSGSVIGLLNVMGRQHVGLASVSGRSRGGSFISWSLDVKVTFTCKDKWGSWTVIKWKQDGVEWGIINVYASNIPRKRAALWASIRNKMKRWGDQVAWLLLGDFNMVEAAGDRLGGGETVSGFEKEQWDRLLMEHGFLEVAGDAGFTWCNGAQGTARAAARHDRCYANMLAHQHLPTMYRKNFLLQTASDHNPQIIRPLDSPLRSARKSVFKLNTRYLENDDFLQGCQAAWNSISPSDSAMRRLVAALASVKSFAKQWGRERVCHERAVISQKYAELEQIRLSGGLHARDV